MTGSPSHPAAHGIPARGTPGTGTPGTTPEGTTPPGPSQLGGRLVLASTSPRRRELLTRRGVAFSVSAVGFDDAHLDPGTERDAGRWAQALACLKADAVARTLRAGGQAGGAWVLAADTIVVHAGRMIGKPRDADDAERLIRSMLNDTHEVVTGCAVVRADAPERWLFADRARVTMGGLSDRDLADYLASGRWAGKAGAYNLDEQARAGWPLRWEGDPATVVGLPMQRLEPFLARFAGAKA